MPTAPRGYRLQILKMCASCIAHRSLKGVWHMLHCVSLRHTFQPHLCIKIEYTSEGTAAQCPGPEVTGAWGCWRADQQGRPGGAVHYRVRAGCVQSVCCPQRVPRQDLPHPAALGGKAFTNTPMHPAHTMNTCHHGRVPAHTLSICIHWNLVRAWAMRKEEPIWRSTEHQHTCVHAAGLHGASDGLGGARRVKWSP